MMLNTDFANENTAILLKIDFGVLRRKPYWGRCFCSRSLYTFLFFSLFILFLFGSCKQPEDVSSNSIDTPALVGIESASKGALLSTRFKSIEELKKIVQIDYFNDSSSSRLFSCRKPEVRLTHRSHGQEIVSILKSGISEADFSRVRSGGFWDRVWLVFNSPFSVSNRRDFVRVFNLSRRRHYMFGEGDVAFYDFAETMLYNISDEDLAFIQSKDLSEKGYINTFNHINAQAFMTSLFSEELADFIADIHERYHMPELITGEFTETQLIDLENGPIDNYIDIINNEWGQELGKLLKKKYNINRETYWTPELLTNYLNDMQSYYSWAFEIGFKPFKAEDQVVVRFSNKINIVMEDVSGLN